ncbi:MAG: glycosyltransferase family 2 protein [Prevotella sp.]|nr:glycosyltransferase family 2 protein [Prevotella sp.]
MNVVLSIITVNYNGLEDTCALIDTIASDESVEVIVVDNCSKVNEADIIKERYPQVKTIRSDRNLGFAGGNNLGLQAATGRYLFLINNDTVFKDFNTDALVKRLDSSPSIGVVCPKLRFAWDDHPIQFAGYTPLTAITLRNRSIGYGEPDTGQYDTPHPTPYAHGAAMMVRRDALERVGLMPECYFLYYEELDWSLMFTRAGYEIWYEPACTVYHKESRTTGANSPLKTYYVTRNRLLFTRRNYPLLQRLMTYGYLTWIVAPRDICRHVAHRRPDLVRATLRAIADFYFKPNKSQNTNI